MLGQRVEVIRFLKKIYLFEKQSERQKWRDREKKISNLLVYSANGSNTGH